MVRPVSELPAPVDEHRTRRWQAIRDLLVFQLKIFLDGMKDIVLAPLGLVAGRRIKPLISNQWRMVAATMSASRTTSCIRWRWGR